MGFVVFATDRWKPGLIVSSFVVGLNIFGLTSPPSMIWLPCTTQPFLLSGCKKPTDVDLFFTQLWFIWLERNKTIFQAEKPSFIRISAHAEALISEFHKVNALDGPSLCPVPLPLYWTKPPMGSIKTNVDAGFNNGVGTVGILIRNCDVILMAAYSINLGRVASVEFAESLAIRYGTPESARIWSGVTLVESDSATNIARINMEDDDISLVGGITKENYKSY